MIDLIAQTAEAIAKRRGALTGPGARVIRLAVFSVLSLPELADAAQLAMALFAGVRH